MNLGGGLQVFVDRIINGLGGDSDSQSVSVSEILWYAHMCVCGGGSL